MLPQSFVAVFSLSFAATASAGVTVLFQNDGNWTSHAEKPSALLVSSSGDAAADCTSYGESLLACDEVQDFYEQLNYQKFIGSIPEDGLVWSGCNQSAAANDSGLQYTLCTNSAPIVDKVGPDFSIYPHVNASANGTTFEGLRDHMAFRFMGIPFAQPPIGDLRFKYAQPWTGSFVNATQYSASCMQFGSYNGNSLGLNPWGNSEDCLYLNVFTPEVPDADDTKALKPVLFWIHGGASTSGTGTDGNFDGASLASRSDVVVVTINYRLNIFGYLSLDDEAIPGNYALSDKIAALQWVQDYITAFGGNPNNVTIFGQSAGGGSVVDLITSPRAEGLFDGAIIQSGSKGWTKTQSAVAASIEPYIEPLCNGTGAARLECLQALSADTLLNLTSEGGSWSTVIDNDFTLDLHIAQIAKGRQAVNSVNLMLGFMPEEGQSLVYTSLAPNLTTFREGLDALGPVSGGSFTEELATAILDSGLWVVGNETSSNSGATVYPDAYNASISVSSDFTLTCGGSQLASVGAASASFESMWVYNMERAYALPWYNPYGLCSFPVGQPDTPYYRCHSGDLFEVFGTYYLFDQPVRVPEDIYYTNAVQDMWAAFARTGNPNVDPEYLKVRGYDSTIDLFSNWEWPEFSTWSPRVASLQYPKSSYTTLPEQQHCDVLLPYLSS
ncbi:Carboxylesterase [Lasiodiplodia theobromae]|uniref:Carboxylesterase n=1 Tax=Lasiodiplodia theobromae TaxID=45133 RepID=UPI0015C34D50|nr:Carboxylesterase [Lasiodiplodia theobromae]KAF4544022.1 Carboxylesterase [Lasiodiplodia theobromae]